MSQVELDNHSLPTRQAIQEYVSRASVTQHPFFRSLESAQDPVFALWCFAKNLYPLTEASPQWLASALASTNDRHLQCFYASILFDELGQGDVRNNHLAMLSRMVAGLENRLGPQDDLSLVSPGEGLFTVMGKIFEEDEIDPWHGVGSLLMFESVFLDMFTVVSAVAHRVDSMDSRVFEWVHLHAEVDHDHVRITREILDHAPDSGPEIVSIASGMMWTQNNVSEWLNGLSKLVKPIGL